MKEPLIIIPGKIPLEFFDDKKIDLGMRYIVNQLMNHGYDTIFSCDGHERDRAYITYSRGTGDGSFEKNAKYLGFSPRIKKSCCVNKNTPFCGNCGWGDAQIVYDKHQETPNRLAIF
jgi:hypothetical protein